jgi:hypothetical protein
MRSSAVRGKAGPGRLIGRPNKTLGQARENVAEVFRLLGGVEAMGKWARNHPTEFYRKIYPKLVAVDVQAKPEKALKPDNSAKEALERVLLGIIASRQDGHAEDPLVTDHVPSEGAAPEPVVGCTNGSAAVRKRSG